MPSKAEMDRELIEFAKKVLATLRTDSDEKLETIENHADNLSQSVRAIGAREHSKQRAAAKRDAWC